MGGWAQKDTSHSCSVTVIKIGWISRPLILVKWLPKVLSILDYANWIMLSLCKFICFAEFECNEGFLVVLDCRISFHCWKMDQLLMEISYHGYESWTYVLIHRMYYDWYVPSHTQKKLPQTRSLNKELIEKEAKVNDIKKVRIKQLQSWLNVLEMCCAIFSTSRDRFVTKWIWENITT